MEQPIRQPRQPMPSMQPMSTVPQQSMSPQQYMQLRDQLQQAQHLASGGMPMNDQGMSGQMQGQPMPEQPMPEQPMPGQPGQGSPPDSGIAGTPGIADLADDLNRQLDDQPETKQPPQTVPLPPRQPHPKKNDNAYFDMLKQYLQDPLVLVLLVVIFFQPFMLKILSANISWFANKNGLLFGGLVVVGALIATSFSIYKYVSLKK